MKTSRIVLIVLGIVALLALILGLSLGLTQKRTADGEYVSVIEMPRPIEYVNYVVEPLGDITFPATECEACTTITNIASAGALKEFAVTDILDGIQMMSVVLLDVNLILTDLEVKSETQPIMFYGNTKDPRITNNSLVAFYNYYRYYRPFPVNFIKGTSGKWKLQCDFLSTYVDATSPTMLIQLCVLSENITQVTANAANANDVTQRSLLTNRIFARIKNDGNVNVLVIDNNPQTINNKWVSLICPTAEVCATSCLLCSTLVSDYRNRKTATGALMEKSIEAIAFGKVTNGTTAVPGFAFLLPGDMMVTAVEITSTNTPAVVEISADGTLTPIPIVFVKNTAGAWVWDVSMVYNHLRRKLYLQVMDEAAPSMNMYFIEPADLPTEVSDFKRSGYVAQRETMFLLNAAFVPCQC